VIEAREASGALIVSKVGYRPLPPTAVQNNMVVEADQVSAAIAAAVKQIDTSTRSVVTVVPAPAVIVKKAVLPIQNPQNPSLR
jgi:Tfp pilus assembly PilM family ATPase